MRLRYSGLPVLIAVTLPFIANAQQPAEGVHYERLSVPYGVDENVIISIFSPGCQYCYRLEDPLADWIAERGYDVVRVPFFHNDRWAEAGRLVLAMQATGHDDDALIAGLFDAIHVDGVDDDDPQALLAALPLDHQSREDILATIGTAGIRAREGEIRAWLQENRIVVVPTLVVDDHLFSDPARARGNSNLLLLLDYIHDQK